MQITGKKLGTRLGSFGIAEEVHKSLLLVRVRVLLLARRQQSRRLKRLLLCPRRKASVSLSKSDEKPMWCTVSAVPIELDRAELERLVRSIDRVNDDG